MTNREWLKANSELTGREIVKLAEEWYEKEHGEPMPKNVSCIIEWLQAERSETEK